MPLSDDMIQAVADSQARIDAQNAEFTARYHDIRRSEGCVRVPIEVNGPHGTYETHTFARPIEQYVQGGPELGGSIRKGWAVEMPALREGDSFTVTWPGGEGKLGRGASPVTATDKETT